MDFFFKQVFDQKVVGVGFELYSGIWTDLNINIGCDHGNTKQSHFGAKHLDLYATSLDHSWLVLDPPCFRSPPIPTPPKKKKPHTLW